MAKIIGKIIVVLLMVAAVGWYLYDVLVNGAGWEENIIRTLGIVCVAAGALLRGEKRYRKGLRFYENAYGQYIKNAFHEDPSARKKLLCAYRFYDENALRKAEGVAMKLKDRCLSNGDREGVYLVLALVHTEMGLSLSAIEEYEELIKRGVISATIYNNLGQQYAAIGDRDKALEY